MNTKENLPLNQVRVLVDDVYVTGAQRINPNLLDKQLINVYSATNFEELVARVSETRKLLERTGIFRDVEAFIDISTKSDIGKERYKVRFDVIEENTFKTSINTLIGTNDGSLLFELKSPNIFGNGESLAVDYTMGTKNMKGFGAHLKIPLFYNPDWSLQFSGLKYIRESPWNGSRETIHGPVFQFNLPSILGQHSLRYEGFHTNIDFTNNTLPLGIRKYAGNKFKSTISHTLRKDLRDSAILPNLGIFFQTKQELAGIYGDVNYFKHTIDCQFIQPFIYNMSLQLSLSTGFLKSFGGNESINDRFYIGGPLTLRGFQLSGAGNQQSGFSFGSECFLGGSLNFYTPIPFQTLLSSKMIKSQFFTNFAAINNGYNWKKSIRLSYGLGLVMNLSNMARIEVNYCFPLIHQSGDRIQQGLQFGIGMEFW